MNKIKRPVYVKVQDSLYPEFERQNISPISRLVYMSLSSCLYHNSAIATASYEILKQKTGISSSATISKSLKELKDKKFVGSMGGSSYRLWIGVFKGIEEQEHTQVPPMLQKPLNQLQRAGEHSPQSLETYPHEQAILAPKNHNSSSRGEQLVSSNNEHTHAHVLFFNNKEKKEQRQYKDRSNESSAIDDDFFLNFKNNLSLKSGSAFGSISEQTLKQWIQRFGSAHVQTTLEKLDLCYTSDQIKSTAVGLAFKAITEGAEWDFESKQRHELETKLRKRAEIEIMESNLRDEAALRQREYEAEDIIFNDASTDMELCKKAVSAIRQETVFKPLDEQSPFFKAMFRSKLIALFQEEKALVLV